jgi:hypothetical protein
MFAGTPSVSISLWNYPKSIAMMRSRMWWIRFRSEPTSSPRTPPSRLLERHDSSCTTCGSYMDCLEMWFRTEVSSSFESSLLSCAPCWQSELQLQLHITCRPMRRPNESTKSWSSIFASSSMSDRTTGMTSCLWLSLQTVCGNNPCLCPWTRVIEM